MTKFFNKFKNSIFDPFWPIFPILGQIFFPQHLAVPCNYLLVSSTMPKFRKKQMIQFQENAWLDGWIDGKTDRP